MRLSEIQHAFPRVFLKNFYIQHVTREARVIFGLVLLAFSLGCLAIAVNALTTQYPGFDYLPLRWVFLAPAVFVVLWLATAFNDKSPRMAFFTRTYCTYFFIAIAFSVITNGIQFTPFPPIDQWLLHLDQVIGFQTMSLMHWTAQHHAIKKILELAYEFLNIEMLLIPLILPLFKDEKRVHRLFIAMLISFLIGTAIYYFFPTSAPVSVIDSPYFLSSEHATALKFYQIHHYVPVTTGDGGLIAFPSFHVVWAILLCYAVRGKHWLFYPLVLINLLVIASTLLLGWHYLVDVIAGAILAMVAITLARHILHS